MEKIGLKKFLDYRFVGSLQASPEESKYAFLVSKAVYDKNEYHHALYTGNRERVSKELNLKKNQDYIFLSEDRLLLNYQRTKREEKEVKEAFKQSFYTYDLQQGELKKAFTLPFAGKLEERLSEHKILVSAFMQEDDHVLYEGGEKKRKTHLKRKKEAAAYEEIEELPYYFNGVDFIANKHRQLFIYDIENDEIKRLLPKNFTLGGYALSEDKNTLYYTGSKWQKVATTTSKIFACDLESGEHRTLYDKLDYNIAHLFELKGKLFAIAKDMEAYGLNQNPDFFLVENGEMKLHAEFGQSVGNTVGTDCRLSGSKSSFVKDDAFYFTTTADDHVEVHKMTFEGTIDKVFAMPGSVDGLVKLKEEAVMVGMKEQRLQEIYRLNLKKQTLRMLSRINARVLSGHYVAKPQTIVVRKDNHEIKGFVLLPKHYNPAKKYPAILNIHGGPKTVYGQIFFHEMQYWANQGYLVLFANPRGSDGKGNAFADIRGKYGTIDYDDLMDFTDEVLAKYPAIDQDRLFVTGGSYGGFMTNWMVTQTDRFKAAATQRSISNWLSFYGTSDIGNHFATDQTGGHPITDMDKLYNQSPIKYALDVKTPLLLIHSDKDHRCPMEQAQQFYAVLKTNGVDCRLVWFKGENHELSRAGKPQARVKRLQEITGWFDKYR